MDSWDRAPSDNGIPQICAFCGASASPERQLVAGPTNVCICSECVVFAYNMLEVSGALPRDTDVDAQPSVWGDESTGVHNIDDLKRD